MKKLLFSLTFFICLHQALGQKINSSFLSAIDTSITSGTYPNIHSILISYNNKLIYEKYWPGEDQKFGKPVGVIPHGSDHLHSLRA